MSFTAPIISYLGKYGSATVIIVLILIIIAIKFNGKVRKLAYTYIPEAEDGTITRRFKKGVLDYITRLQDSDLDERMVEVIAVLLQQIPVLRIIPFNAATKYLNALTQKAFNNVKKALDSSINSNPVNSRISESDIDELLGASINSASNSSYEVLKTKFTELEKEVSKLKDKDNITKDDIISLEDVVKLLDTPTLKK